MAKADLTKWNAKRDMPALKALVDATRAGTFIYADPNKMQAHKALDYVEFNLNMPNPENAAEFAARATATALQEMPDPNATSDNSNKDTETMSETNTVENAVGSEAVAEATSRAPRNPIRVANVVKGMSALPIEAKGTPRGRKSQYDFASLVPPTLDDVGNVTAAAFLFIPNLDGRPNMKKVVAGNVAAYNAKMKDVIDPATGRRPVFKAYDAMQVPEGGGEAVPGVSIYRVS